MTTKIDKLLLAASAYDQKTEKLLKTANVQEIATMLSRYPGTAAFLRDVAKAQFHLVDLDPNQPEDSEEYRSSKLLAEAIDKFANEFEQLESKFW
jgi:hypothetical protein